MFGKIPVMVLGEISLPGPAKSDQTHRGVFFHRKVFEKPNDALPDEVSL